MSESPLNEKPQPVISLTVYRELLDALRAAPDFGGTPKTPFGREYRVWQIQAREAMRRAEQELS